MIRVNTAGLIRDMRAFQAKFEVKWQNVVLKIAGDLWVDVVNRTPVDTGRARANWNLTIGEPAQGWSEGASGQPAMGDLARWDGTKSIWIVNNVPYIEFLENGSSKQAPAGMLQVAVANIRAKLQLYVEGAR